MATGFDLRGFLADPSYESFSICRKDDLLQIAAHFNVGHSRQILKRDLQGLVLAELLERELVMLPVPAGPTEDSRESVQGVLAGEPPKTPVTMPRYDPLSSTSTSSIHEARLKVRLARLRFEAEERAQNREVQLKLDIKRLEIEAETAVRIRELELASQTKRGVVVDAEPSASLSTGSAPTFDINKNMALVPVFREVEVDSYFSAFERIASALRWPSEVWALMLQCKIQGKAQDAVAALPVEESLSYEHVKSAILRAYELVPEAYRQKFRACRKTSDRTYVEFAREKGTLFDKWCSSCKVADYKSLREMVLVEEFKRCLPDRIVVYLNEQKVSSLSCAAVLADEYVLTHKAAFGPQTGGVSDGRRSSASGQTSNSVQKDDRECYYCHKTGHVIANCLTRKGKESGRNTQFAPPKGIGLIKAEPNSPQTFSDGDTLEECFKPFTFDGLVSLACDPANKRPVRILRDTACSQSVILSSVLPFSDQSACGYGSVLRGVEMGYMLRPVHRVFVQSELITGYFPVSVCPELPIEGISFLMGNDIAGGKVTPSLEVLNAPQRIESEKVNQGKAGRYSACVITRARARKRTQKEKMLENEISLCDTVLMSSFTDGDEKKTVVDTRNDSAAGPGGSDAPVGDRPSLPVSRSRLSEAQKADLALKKCFSKVVGNSSAADERIAYYMEEDLLMRKWSPSVAADAEWGVVSQVVVPAEYRTHVLSVAHESDWSGHLGVNKTYQLLLKHFFWPGIKGDVVKYCRSCHVCQLVGKPNQVVPPAPLHPIPVVGEAFDRVIVDCVGPLPRTKSGNEYLLTIMCAATRFPEAIPMRKITASSVAKGLTKFFSTFGLPRTVQTDQGTNFQSKLFNQVLQTLNVQHAVSSAYHPESQGALERWHQTLKSMLRKYCIEKEKNWDEGVPFVLFAAREAVQESLGFSPAQLVFGHTPRGPLQVLQEKFLSTETASGTNVLEYVSKFRERLHGANAIARKMLAASQGAMKQRFDRRAVQRNFHSGDKVLALLPVPGSSLSAKFSGPYEIQDRLSDTDYVISTPERRKKTQMCHVNMLKAYFTREPVAPGTALMVTAAAPASEDSFVPRSADPQTARLSNSEMLQELPSRLDHLFPVQQQNLLSLVGRFPELFGDVPSQTSVLSHDVDVKNARPVKQHAYRVNSVKRALMKQEAEYLLRHGFARPSSSPWSSPCLVGIKPDGSPRFITDFRKVNGVTVPDSYPLPRMEDCVDNLGTAKFVSKLDLLKGYWQVPLTERASKISAFVTPDHFLEYTVMAFGMCNAPATFQRLVNVVLSGVPNCNAYLDDLIVYTRSWEEHVQVLEQVFTRLRSAKLTLNLAKCDFGEATVTYLGRRVGQGQVRPVEAKVSAISACPVPTNRKALRSFLGMAGYYRSFCRNFSSVVHSLTNLLSPKVEYVWTAECNHAFESVKSLLTHAPVLAAPDFTTPFKLEVDASAVGAGAVLLQEDEGGVDHPVSYFSKKFDVHQVNYSTIEKETLALLLALQHFEVYLGSSSLPIVVYTDHNPLVFLMRMYNQNQRLMRWALAMQDYSLEIRHKKGSENVVADALSRL